MKLGAFDLRGLGIVSTSKFGRQEEGKSPRKSNTRRASSSSL